MAISKGNVALAHNYNVDQYELVKKRMSAYLTAKGNGRKPLARGNFAALVNSSDALAKLIDADPEFEAADLSARVIDTWVTGDTSPGYRRFTQPLGIHLRAIAEYLISERRLTKEELETAGSGQLPAMYLAEFLEQGKQPGRYKEVKFPTLAAVLEVGDEISLRFLDFMPLPTQGSYSVVETRNKLDRNWGEDDAVFYGRIGNALAGLDDRQLFKTNQDWTGFGVLTDTAFLICLRPPLATPSETSCVYHVAEYQIADLSVDRLTTSVSGQASDKLGSVENVSLIQSHRLNFFSLSKIRDNIEFEYEEHVSRALFADEKFMFDSGESRENSKVIEEFMTERNQIRKVDAELILHCKDGEFKKVRSLLNESANPNFVDPNSGWRPIQIAAAAGAFSVLEELLNCENLDVLVATSDGILPSQLVSTHRLLPTQLETLNKLIDREAAAAEEMGIAHEDLLTRRAELPVPGLS